MKNYNEISDQWNEIKKAFSDLKNSFGKDKEVQINDILTQTPFPENYLIEFDSQKNNAAVCDTNGQQLYTIKLSFWLPTLICYLNDTDKRRIGKVKKQWITFPDIEDYWFDGHREYQKYKVYYHDKIIQIVSYIKKKDNRRYFVIKGTKGKIVSDSVKFTYDFIIDKSLKMRSFRLTQRFDEIMVQKFVMSCDNINEEMMLLYLMCIYLSSNN